MCEIANGYLQLKYLFVTVWQKSSALRASWTHTYLCMSYSLYTENVACESRKSLLRWWPYSIQAGKTKYVWNGLHISQPSVTVNLTLENQNTESEAGPHLFLQKLLMHSRLLPAGLLTSCFKRFTNFNGDSNYLTVHLFYTVWSLCEIGFKVSVVYLGA